MSDAWDAIVVGSGPSGVLVAETLSAAGWSTLVVEAGPVPGGPFPDDDTEFLTKTQPFLAVDEAAWRYQASRPFEWLRVRAAGGRSLMWGGWCAPPERRCLEEAREQGAPWPIDFPELQRYVKRVARRLHVRRGRLHPRLASLRRSLGIEVHPKVGSTAPKNGRPLYALDLLGRARLRGKSPVLRVARDRSGAAIGVEVAGKKPGQTRLMRARVVVLCASPIESARIIHLSDPGGVGAHDGPLGRGLVDHMVSGILVINDEPASVEHPGPLAHAAWSQQRSRSRTEADGYIIEVRGPTPVATYGESWLAAFGVDPRTSERLTSYTVHTMAAAAPNPRRRVSFDRTERDSLGRPIPFLRLSWSARDRSVARRIDIAARNVAETLAGPSGRVIRVHDPLEPGGVGHETGTARMGTREADSVTDGFGEVRGFPRLFVADASVLPTLFDRHPSLTLLAVSLRIADQLVARGRRGEI